MRVRTRVAVAVLIGLASGRAAQALDPHRALIQYGHDIWRTADGLPQNAVLAVLQTRDGYLWLGTTSGLVRFDGVRFTVFDKANTEAIGHNQISALFEDREGSLWIGTFGGGLTKLQNRRFTTYTTRDGLSHDVVKAICQDRAGGLWIATLAHGVNRFEGGRFSVYSTENGLPHDDVFAVAPSRDGGVWIGTSGGLARFRDGQFTTYTTRDGLPSNRVVSVYEDRKGSLWAGTRDRGLVRFRDGRFWVYTVADGLSSDAVFSIHEDRAGALWFATKDHGLNRLYDGRFSAYTTKEGLSSDVVYSVVEDLEGSLWIGTFGGGLNRLRDARFTVFTTQNGLPHDHVRSVFEDAEGQVWFATFGGGLGRMKDGRFTTLSHRDGLPHDRLYCVLRDRWRDLWIGTDGAGLVRLRGGRFTRYTTRDGLAHDNVRALYEDRQGSLWVGTSGGLSRLRDGRFTSYTTADGLSSDAVHAILQDRAGALWLGTWGGGLSRLQNGTFTAFSRKDGVPNDFILSFYEDPEGSLWIGTLGGGLVRLREGRFRAYTTKEGLFEDLVYQVFEDGRENLWISCNKGVYRVSKRELNDLDRGLLRSVRSVAFGVADGMPSGECASGSQPLGAKSRDGRLWIPTQSGVVVIDPDHLETNQVPPPVVIEELLVDRRPVAVEGQPSLPPGGGDLEFHYTGLSFLVPGKVRFKYKLEGWNDDWVDAGPRRIAAYTNIPPGRYRFRMAAANADGVWNETGASFEFRLRPHFHQTWWFYGLVAMGVSLAGIGLHRLRVRQVEAEFAAVLAERTRMSRELHDTLAQGFAGIAIHLDAAAACLPKGVQELRGHLGLARALVRESLAEARRAVLDLRPHALEHADLATALSEMAGRLATDSAIHVEVTGEPRLLSSAVEGDLLRIAQEAVTNALRHAGAHEIRVHLDFDADHVSLRILDDGHGFAAGVAMAPSSAGHLGLVGIRERAARIGGQFTLHSQAGAGTEVVVEVPLRHTATVYDGGEGRTH
jgi:ligand-binding sensor domain-containing protein/signal transduction histidine kinase